MVMMPLLMAARGGIGQFQVSSFKFQVSSSLRLNVQPQIPACTMHCINLKLET
jgi:hypothetical protein